MRYPSVRAARAALAVVLVPVLSLTLAGCGESAVNKYVKEKPSVVDQNMRDAMNAMTSVHIHTTYTESGSTFTMDASLDNAGRCIATLVDGTQTLSVIGTNPTTLYAKGSTDFWTQSESTSAAAAAQLADKWVTGFPSTLLSGICDLKAVVKPFITNTIAQDSAKILGKTTVQGKDAVKLQIAVASATATLSVLASTPHYPVSVVSSDGKRTELLSEFNAPVKPTAPAGATDVSGIAPAQ